MLYLYTKRFMGDGPNNIFEVREDLAKEKGDKITYQLMMKLSGTGVSADSPLEASEEALTFYNDTVTIQQLRNAVRLDGKVTEQRVVFNLQNQARIALGMWMAEKLDSYNFRFQWGDTSLTHGETPDAPEATAIVYGGDATSTADVDASDTFDLTLIDACKEKALTRSPELRPLNIDGDEYFVIVLHPYQITDLRTNTGTGQWQDMQKAAMAYDGQKNPVFTGANAIHNGVLIHSHKNCNTETTWGAGGDVNGAEALFWGAQAGCYAWGLYPFWKQKLFDFDNQVAFATGAIWGTNRSRFNSLDYATFVVRTAAASHS
jgi:N4-gp56 family major capsid protein